MKTIIVINIALAIVSGIHEYNQNNLAAVAGWFCSACGWFVALINQD